MAQLKEHFYLNRDNFSLNPKTAADDRQLFFGNNRNQDVVENLENRYMSGDVARYYVYGNYGTGKTHLLYHLKAHFEKNRDLVQIRPLLVQVEAQTASRFQTLHRRMLDAIGLEDLERTYSQYANQYTDYDERSNRMRELFPSTNVANAMAYLQSSQQNRSLAWRWLSAEKLSTTELSQLAVTSALSDTGDLIELMTSIGELYRLQGENLLFLIDEAESLHNVTNRDAQISWHDAFRRLSDEENQSIGFMLSFYTFPSYPPPSFMEEADIMSRIGEYGKIILEPYGMIEVKKFLNDLLKEFVDKDLVEQHIKNENLDSQYGIFPFSREGFEAFNEEAKNNAERTIPRTIIRAINACAIEGLRTGNLLIDTEIVDQKGREEFSSQ